MPIVRSLIICLGVLSYQLQITVQVAYRNILKSKGTEKTIWGSGSKNSSKLISDDNPATFVSSETLLLKDDKRAHILVDLKQPFIVYGSNVKSGNGVALGIVSVYVSSRLVPTNEDLCATKDSTKAGSGKEWLRIVCQNLKGGYYIFLLGGANGQFAVAELEIIASPLNLETENVAYRKTTEMSPKSSNNKVSDLAVDGNTAQNLDFAFSCAVTEPAYSPWLCVDLDWAYDVKTVVLYGTDGNAGQTQMPQILKDIEVRVGFTIPSDDTFTLKQLNSLCGSWMGEPPITMGPVIIINCKVKDSDSQNFDNSDLAVIPPGNVIYDVTIPQLHKDYKWKVQGIVGQYVTIQMLSKPGDKPLNVLALCEIEVYGSLIHAPDRENFALNQRSYDNSDASNSIGYLPILANDGSRGMSYCFYITQISDPTWIVNLGSVYQITYIVITKGFKEYQWDYVQLLVGFNPKGTDNPICNFVSDNSKALTISIKCTSPKRGSFVSVQKISASNPNNPKSLELCEVELYGADLNLGSNIAYGNDRATSQSSIAVGPKYVKAQLGPKLAIDGYSEWSLMSDSNDVSARSFCSETLADDKKRNFWMIDLKVPYKVEAVLINGGIDVSGLKLESYTIYFGLDESAASLFSVYRSTPLGSTRYHLINVTKPGDKGTAFKDAKLARLIKITPTKNEHGPNVLRFCEVEIYGMGNVAIKRPSFQSGINAQLSSGTADKANDGQPLYGSKLGACQPSMTKSVVDPFWAVYLDGIYRIGYIDVLNRNDQKYNLLQNLYASVGFYGVPNLNQPCGSAFMGPPPLQGYLYEIRCAAFKEAFPRGKFVTLMLHDEKEQVLSVCEVSVYGEKETQTNIAAHEMADDSQKSPYAMLANDGLYLTDSNIGYCLTLKGAKSWWRLNLKNAQRIDYVNIWQASGSTKSYNVYAGFREEVTTNSKCISVDKASVPSKFACIDLTASSTFHVMGSIHGHYVVVEAVEDDSKICEIEVFGDSLGQGKRGGVGSSPPFLYNDYKARVKTTQGSKESDLSSSPETKGLEKVLNGQYFSSCLTIGPDKKPWWMVKFASIYSIYQINVYGPIDCCWPFEQNMVTRVGYSKIFTENAVCWDIGGQKGARGGKISQPCFSKLINGLYASVELNDNTNAQADNKLVFCQVEILGYDMNFASLVRGTGTWVDQSSTFNPAERAIDQVLDTGICASTKTEFYPFWRVHLKLPYSIEGFSIFVGKSEVSKSSLEGLWVTAGFMNDPFINPICFKMIRPSIPPNSDFFVTKCQETLVATYFSIIIDSKHVGKKSLRLCEVEIYGSPAAFEKMIKPKEIKGSSGGPWINAINGDIKERLIVHKYASSSDDDVDKGGILEAPNMPLACVQSGPERQAWIKVNMGRDHILWNVVIYQYQKFPFPKTLIGLSYNDSIEIHAECGRTDYQSTKFVIVVECKPPEDIFQRQKYNFKRSYTMGCFNLGPLNGAKSEFQMSINDEATSPTTLTDTACAEACYVKKFRYSATTLGSCFCSNNIGIYGRSGSETACDTPCPGNKGHFCGGKQSFSAYYTGYKPRWTSYTFPIGRNLILKADSAFNAILAVCELEVYGQPILFPNMNIAHGKPTINTPKNTEFAYNDFELKTHLYAAKGLNCLILPRIASPWYIIDLLSLHTVIGAYVSTYYPDDYNSNFWDINTWERYEQYEIRVGHTPYPSQNQLCYSSNLRTFTATCPSIRGTYVSLQLLSQQGEIDQMVVCSFLVYGEPTDLGPSNVAYFKHAYTTDGFATQIVDGLRALGPSQCSRVSKGPAIWIINLRDIHMVTSFNILFDTINDALETYVGHYPQYWNALLCSSSKPEGKTFSVSKCTKPLFGRYFIIFVTTSKPQDVSLCEIEVFGYPSAINVARSGFKTQQSQTETSAESKLAVDGKSSYTSSAYIAVCSSITAAIKDPWWSINLESIFVVDYISVTRRKETCGLNADKMHKFQFRVGFGKVHWKNPICSEYEGKMYSLDGMPIIVECVSGASIENKFIYDVIPFLGQFVSVNLVSPSLNDVEKLTLCEVEVYGKDAGFIQLKGSQKFVKSVGCFATLPGQESTFKPQQITVPEDDDTIKTEDPTQFKIPPMTNAICNRECKVRGMAFSATKGGSTCMCGQNLFSIRKTSLDDSDCDIPCNGNKLEMCGGEVSMTVSLTTMSNPSYGRNGYMTNGDLISQLTDGISDPYRVGSCFSWAASSNPFIKIELSSTHWIVGAILILNSCCYQKLKDFEIKAGPDSADPMKNYVCYKSIADQTYGTVNFIRCEHALLGSTVSINVKQEINVCELVILGQTLNLGYNAAYGKTTRCSSGSIPDNAMIVHDSCQDNPETRLITDGDVFMYSCFTTKPTERLILEIDLGGIYVVSGVLIFNPFSIDDKTFTDKTISSVMFEARLKPAGAFDWPTPCGSLNQTYSGQLGYSDCKNAVAKYIAIRSQNQKAQIVKICEIMVMGTPYLLSPDNADCGRCGLQCSPASNNVSTCQCTTAAQTDPSFWKYSGSCWYNQCQTKSQCCQISCGQGGSKTTCNYGGSLITNYNNYDFCTPDPCKNLKCKYKCSIDRFGQPFCYCQAGMFLKSDQITCGTNPCSTNPCKGAQCMPLDSESYKCYCPRIGFSYIDGMCCDNYFRHNCFCASNAPYFEKICSNFKCLQAKCQFGCTLSEEESDKGSPICTCPNGMIVSPDDKKACIANPCFLKNGLCSHICQVIVGMAKCSCPEGLELRNPEQKICCSPTDDRCFCPPSYDIADNKSCLYNPCKTLNGGCSHYCYYDHNTKRQSCFCPRGFSLAFSKITNDLSKTCVKDQCLSSKGTNPLCPNRCLFEHIPYPLDIPIKCSTNNICYPKEQADCPLRSSCQFNNQTKNSNCICPPESVSMSTLNAFNGLFTNRACCNSDPLTGTRMCNCSHGQIKIVSQDGILCVPDRCGIEGHNCSHFCRTIFEGGYVQKRCICKSGYILGVDGASCCSLKEPNCLCQKEGDNCCPNLCDGKCSHGCIVKNIGSKCQKVCTCPPGLFLGKDNLRCWHNQCQLENGGCHHICHTFEGIASQIVTIDTSSMICSCYPGYALGTDGKTCYKNDLCFPNNGGCVGSCLSFQGRKMCSCYGIRTETSLKSGKDSDIENISDRNGTSDWFLHGDGHSCCSLTTGKCICNSSMILSADGSSCLPNPCTIDNGGCADLCTLTSIPVPQAICSCKSNYYVSGDHSRSCCKYEGLNVIDCYCASNCRWLKNTTDCIPNPCFINNGNCPQVCHFDGYKKTCRCYPKFYSSQKSCCPHHRIKNLGCTCSSGLIANPTASKLSCVEQSCTNIQLDDRCSQSCMTDLETLTNKCFCRLNSQGDLRQMENDKSTCISSSNSEVISCPYGKIWENERKCRWDDYQCQVLGYPCSQICSLISMTKQANGPKNVNYICSCLPGFQLQDDKKSCCKKNGNCFCVYPSIFSSQSKKCDSNLCLEGKGGCAHGCKLSSSGTIECFCKQGFTLGSDKKSCCIANACECGIRDTYDLKTKKCIPNNCVEKNLNRLKCSHACLSLPGKCVCNKGFILSTDGLTCLNVNAINSKILCKIGTENCLECKCASGEQLASDGQTCIIQGIGKDCSDNGLMECADICEKNSFGITCKCKSGSYLNPDLRSCCSTLNEDGGYGKCRCSASSSSSPLQDTCLINLCKYGPNPCSYQCIKSNRGKICICPTNFTLGNDGSSCFYDHCLLDSSRCTQVCLPAHDKIICACQTGFKLGRDQRICCPTTGNSGCVCPKEFYLCNKNTVCCLDPCKVNNGGCSDFCKMGPEGQALCSCRKGAILKPDGKTCECTAVQECGPKCQSVSGKKVCQCPATFLPTIDTKVCLKDACLSDKLLCSEICTSIDGKIVCSCASPNKFTGADNRVCYADTCTNMKCSYKCRSLNGVPECLCPEGKYLGPDKLNCIDDPCFSVKCTHNCTIQDDIGVCSCLPQHVLGLDGKTCYVDNCAIKSICSQICVTNLTNGLPECSCSDNYFSIDSGKICIKDECVNKNLNCEHLCKMDAKTLKPICACFNESFVLASDGIHCYIDACKVNNGGCAQKCAMNTKDGTVICNCDGDLKPSPLDPYACCDASAKNCKCNQLSIANKERTRCFPDRCKLGISNKGDCSQKCKIDELSGNVICFCDEGFLLGSDGKTCWKNLCQSDKKDKCQFNCTVDLVSGNKLCTCPEGQVLDADEKSCVKSACDNDELGRICAHFCVPHHKSYYCTCRPGFYLDYDNSSCCDIEAGQCECNDINLRSMNGKRCYENFCLKNNANCSNTCLLSLDTGDAVCTCPTLFRIDPSNNKTCIKDPCFMSNGDCQQLCSVGMFKDKICSCFPGFILDDDKKSCQIDACAKYNGGCAQNCKSLNGQAQCNCDTAKGWRTAKDDPSKCCSSVTSKGTGMVCQCNKDLSILSGDGLKCFPDLCKSTPRGGCQHYCNISQDNGSKSCKCRTGFTLNEDGYSCTCKIGYTGYNCDVDRDECAENDNDCDSSRAKCINTLGSYNCECKPGYKGDGKTCQDIDECARISCSSHANCFNFEGGFQDCTCDSGYYVDAAKGTGCFKGEASCPVTLSFDPHSYSEDMGQKMHPSYHKFQQIVTDAIYTVFKRNNFPAMRSAFVKEHKRISSTKVIADIELTFEGNQFPEESNVRLLLKESLNQVLSETASINVIAVDMDCPGFKVPDPLSDFVAKPSDYGIKLEWKKTDNVAKIVLKWGVYESAKPKRAALPSQADLNEPHLNPKRALAPDNVMEIDAKKNTHADVTAVKPSTTYSISATPVNKIGYGRSQTAIVKTKDHIYALGSKRGSGRWLWIVLLALFLLIAFTALILYMVIRKRQNSADSPFEVIIKQKFRKLRGHKDHKSEEGDAGASPLIPTTGIEIQADPGTGMNVATPDWDDYDAYYKYDTDYDYYSQTDNTTYSDPYYIYGEDPYYDYDASQDPYGSSQQASTTYYTGQDGYSYGQYDPSAGSYNYSEYTSADTTNQSQETLDSTAYNYTYDPSSYNASSAEEGSQLSTTGDYTATGATESGEGTYSAYNPETQYTSDPSQYVTTEYTTDQSVVDPNATYTTGYENDTQQYSTDAVSQDGYYDEAGVWHYNSEVPT